jgi:hypothetical protein
LKKAAPRAKIQMPLALKGKEDMVDQAVVTLLDLTKVCSKNLSSFHG